MYFKCKNLVMSEQETSLFKGFISTVLDEVEEEQLQPLEYKGGKITRETWEQIKSFLLHSYQTYKGEAQIRIFYNQELGIWKAQPFEQWVSNGLSTTELKDSPKTEEAISNLIRQGYVAMSTVHHHCDIDAFQSSTDYRDEEKNNGLHVTLGHMGQPVLHYHSRHTLRGVVYPAVDSQWFEEGFEEWLTTPVATDLFPVEWKEMFKERVVVTPSFPPANSGHSWLNGWRKKQENLVRHMEEDGFESISTAYEDIPYANHYGITDREGSNDLEFQTYAQYEDRIIELEEILEQVQYEYAEMQAAYENLQTEVEEEKFNKSDARFLFASKLRHGVDTALFNDSELNYIDTIALFVSLEASKTAEKVIDLDKINLFINGLGVDDEVNNPIRYNLCYLISRSVYEFVSSVFITKHAIMEGAVNINTITSMLPANIEQMKEYASVHCSYEVLFAEFLYDFDLARDSTEFKTRLRERIAELILLIYKTGIKE